MNKLFLKETVVKGNRVDFYFCTGKTLSKYFKAGKHMFLEFNHDISDIPKSILTIPFVANVIPLVWITGSDLYVKELDRSFYECLSSIRDSYQKMFPKVKFTGRIIPNNVINNSYVPEIEAASLFSGGLDALTTFIRVKDKKPLLITEYGWHENDITQSDVWEIDKKNAMDFAKRYQLDNILVQSNYGTFINAVNIDSDFRRKLGDSWWHGLHHSLAIISAAIPMAFKLKIKYIYIASTDSPNYHYTCASNPTVDNEIRYASGKVIHDANELTRQDKVRVVVNHFASDPVNIRVCFRMKDNCCYCEKCLRTILGIVAEGKDPRDFGFNIKSNLSQHVKDFLNDEVKFLTDTLITVYWEKTQARMRENYEKVLFRDLLDWYLDYDFAAERRKALLHYRLTNFFPILKRRINTRIGKLLAKYEN